MRNAQGESDRQGTGSCAHHVERKYIIGVSAG